MNDFAAALRDLNDSIVGGDRPERHAAAHEGVDLERLSDAHGELHSAPQDW